MSELKNGDDKMSAAKETILRFVLKSSDDVSNVFARFFPGGRIVLNRSEWRGKDPRTCGVTQVNWREQRGSHPPFAYDIQVNHRPLGCITYQGSTRFDGWTAMVLDQMKDGTLLDGHGQPLLPNRPPVYIPFKLFDDIEFNSIDFGEFVGEFDSSVVGHRRYEDVLREIKTSSQFSASLFSTFLVPHRQRPMVKVLVSDAPSDSHIQGAGTRIININKSTPHLQQVLIDQLLDLVCGFLEGRYSLKSFTNGDLFMVDLSDILVDGSQPDGEARYNCLGAYVPAEFFDELAKRLMAKYEVEVAVVDGEKPGLLMRRPLPRSSHP